MANFFRNAVVKVKFIRCVVLLSLIIAPTTNAAKNSDGGFIDLNFYPYLQKVKSDSVVTINVGAKLANRFSYFSLLNFSNQGDSYSANDTTLYYTEQNLRWQIAEQSPIDLTLQANFRSGEDNDRIRLGVRWRLNNTEALAQFFRDIHLSYSINLHALQFDTDDAYVWQLEHVFYLRFPYISKNLYFAGFVDHTFNETLPDFMPSNPIVAEAQLGYQLIDNFYITTEYRKNEYRTAAVDNLSYGLQYKIIW